MILKLLLHPAPINNPHSDPQLSIQKISGKYQYKGITSLTARSKEQEKSRRPLPRVIFPSSRLWQPLSYSLVPGIPILPRPLFSASESQRLCSLISHAPISISKATIRTEGGKQAPFRLNLRRGKRIPSSRGPRRAA